MPDPRDRIERDDPRPSDKPLDDPRPADFPPAGAPQPIDLPPASDPRPVGEPPTEDPQPVDDSPPSPGETMRLGDDADAIPVPVIGPPALAAASDDEAADGDDDEATPNRRRTLLLIAGALVLVAVGALVGLFAAQLSRPPGDDQVIAQVGPTAITRGEFLRRYSGNEDPKALLDQLIDAELVIQASNREGVKPDPTQVDKQIEQIRKQGDEAAFKRFLESRHIPSEAGLRDELTRIQLIQAMVYKHTSVEQARARHILLAGNSPDAIAKRKPEAEALLTQLKGGADFAALARQKSEDPGSKDVGGELGWAPRSVFVPVFDEAIFSMKQGELRLIQSDYGWHIIQLQDAPQVRPLESQRYFDSPTVQKALNDTFLPWVKSLRTDAEKTGQVNVIVPPAQIVPSAAPALPSTQPLDVTSAPAP